MNQEINIAEISDLQLAEQIGLHQELLMQAISKEQEESMQLNAFKNEVKKRKQVESEKIEEKKIVEKPVEKKE